MKRQRERDTASRWVPPEQMRRIAAERTGAIRRTMMSEAMWNPLDFAAMCESCYMQGLNDMIDAALQNGWVPGPAVSENQSEEAVIWWP